MQYLDLVNKLRDRFNEVHLTATTWNTVVGFDQFTKDAINYSYHDILNSEMEWPFLHLKTTLQTIPGQQVYNVTTMNTNLIKEIDWDSFFIALNDVVTQIAPENQTIPASPGPYMVSPAQVASWNSDLGVTYTNTGIALIPTDRDPLQGYYTIRNGVYYFAIDGSDAGQAVTLIYRTATASTINVVNSQPLSYMDYDLWRQSRLQIDQNNYVVGSFSQPQWVIKTQQLGEILLSPPPDKIYTVDFECWVDSQDLVNMTDLPIMPTRFDQVIIDGATKYCYEFREDPQQAQLADARAKAGIARMRIELINRDSTMQTGIYWYPHGIDYTMNTL